VEKRGIRHKNIFAHTFHKQMILNLTPSQINNMQSFFSIVAELLTGSAE